MPLSKAFLQNTGRDGISASDLLIVAVSGGIDSMVLCHLLARSGFRIEMAHVNYGLRGAESDGDENFLREFSKTNHIPLHLHHPESGWHDSQGIQEAARQVRYEWLERIRQKSNARFIVTAHHEDDQAETILHQFIRGGMLSALSGMSTFTGKIYRPLLSFTRAEITSYAKDHELAWREDSSNSGIKYTRNYIRHHVMPLLKEINPLASQSLAERALIFSEIKAMTDELLNGEIMHHVENKGQTKVFPIEWLRSHRYKHSLAWQIISAYGFTSAQVSGLLSLLDSSSGRRLESQGHILWRDREHIIVEAKVDSANQEITIDSLEFSLNDPIEIHSRIIGPDKVNFSGHPKKEVIAADEIVLPLTIRPWRHGDQFMPLGMKGHQKLSDYLVQSKIPMPLKKEIYVLETGGEIAWIIGHRISEKFRVKQSSRIVLELSLSQAV